MKEFNFGSLDRRQLHIRFFVPYEFQAGWTFDPRLLLSLRSWWSAIFTRRNWSAGCHRFVGTNHRCFCDCGSMIDGHVKIAGFQLQWFYSRFTGEVPCWCDKVLEELDGPKAGELDDAYHTGDGA